MQKQSSFQLRIEIKFISALLGRFIYIKRYNKVVQHEILFNKIRLHRSESVLIVIKYISAPNTLKYATKK